MVFVIVIFVCYLIGSIPSAVWIGKFVHGIDIREHGSKNAGATNTFRVFGKKSGSVVLFLDVAKGYLAASFPLLLSGMYLGFKDEVLILQLTASFCAIIGHVFPVFAHFRGGKGVASSLGIIIAVNPDTAFICLTCFLLVFVIWKYVSLGAIVAAILFPFVSYFFMMEDARIMIVFSVIISLIVLMSHRKNIHRLVRGEENKMNFLKRKA
ncbi:MAG: glycerol-3-phosphate 1-O-acyltransferase PlsY [Crocinitomicaceae bacterium]|jgi:glycerol-3-phosphate acyltransferase PlsY|tara:strand:+ start:1557 stop:2186 length:630 start_codon:yes stop_codon:yes gene_type:complete